ISHEARGSANYGFPSLPTAGGHVVAWADADNDPATPRVPLFSTITGMYEYVEDTERRGKFELRGLFKQLETSTGLTFLPSYILTLNPLDGSGYDRQAPLGGTVEAYDSLHLSEHGDARGDYSAGFRSQVFVEGEYDNANVYDIEKRALGTPLVYDPITGRVVSAETGASLAVMLPGTTPMFGDRPTEEVCPINVSTAGLTSSRFPDGLRRLRDGVLLRSAVGAAATDAYYRAAPAAAAFLIRHKAICGLARSGAAAIEWVFVHYAAVLLLVSSMVLLRAAYPHKRRAAVAGAVILVACALLFVQFADARIMRLSTEQVVAMSDDIVTGNVTSVESRWAEEGVRKIVTDVSITVTDTVKGRLNKDGQIHLRVPGGRIGAVVSYATDMPRFAEGEEVLLYLEYREGFGYLVVAGSRGKYDIAADGKTGVKYVVAPDAPAKLGLKDAETAIEQDDAQTADENPNDPQPDGKVPLEDLKEYLRDIVKKQDAARKTAKDPQN
ncbi:MAG TPA: hypothetical protein HPP83_05735, partial [Candidatus Hydrogenedentes bacterium]|nr:hypothetical protein [Candidatus Hydrogenedentota bacterium]